MLENKKSNGFFVEIQIVRFIASLIVVISHCGILNVGGGAWSVSFFFVLSGFLSTRKDSKNCIVGISGAIHRIKKMYFPLFITMIVDFVILFNAGEIQITVWDMFGVLSSLSLTSAWFYGFPRLNSVQWFFSALIYFCFVEKYAKLILKKLDKDGLYVVLISIICVEFFLENIFYNNPNRNFWVYNFPPVRFLDYLSGMIMGEIFSKRNVSAEYKVVGKFKITLLYIIAIFCIIFINICFPFVEQLLGRLYYTSIFLPFSIIAIYIFTVYGHTIKDKKNNIFRILGYISRDIFLYHWVILDFFKYKIPNLHGSMVEFLIILISTCGISLFITYTKMKFERYNVQ